MPHFCLDCGQPLQPREIEGRLLEACVNCPYVRWPDPKLVTVTIVETPAGLVFGRRGIEPGYGGWCLPGGFVNDDEHPAVSAARECVEEIGAEVVIGDLIGIYHSVKPGRPGLVAIAYSAQAVDPGQVRAGSEMLEVLVAPPGEAPELVFPMHRSAMTDWLRARESSLRRV